MYIIYMYMKIYATMVFLEYRLFVGPSREQTVPNVTGRSNKHPNTE